MRKFRFILVLALGFGLGLVAQTLFAQGANGGGIWVMPKKNTAVPGLKPRLRDFYDDQGNSLYNVPDGWKVVYTGISTSGNVWIRWRKQAK